MAAFRASGGIGTFEWSPFLVEYAGEAIRRGRSDAAREALAMLAPTARDECDARLLLDALSGTNGKRPALRGANDSSVVLCLEDDRAGRVRLRVESPGESFVVWGWNRGVAGGRRLAPGATEWTLETEGRLGLQSLSLETVTGPRPRIVAAAVVQDGM